MTGDLTFSSVMAGIVAGAIGLWLFREGKRNVNFRILFIGMAMMVYPLFTKGPLQDWGVGIALCTLAYYLW